MSNYFLSDPELQALIGAQLKHLRMTRRGKSIRETSLELGIDNSHLGAIEKGLSFPSLSMFNTLLQYYDQSFKDFFGDIEKGISPVNPE